MLYLVSPGGASMVGTGDLSKCCGWKISFIIISGVGG